MFDIGWSELLVVAIVLIVVVGPKDLPPMIRAFGKMTANLRKMAGEFRTQFDQALKEADMEDVRRTIGDVQNLNPTNALRDAMNPLRQMGQEIRSDLQKASSLSSTPVTATEPVTPLQDVRAPEPSMTLPDTPPKIDPASPVVAPSATPQVVDAAPAPVATSQAAPVEAKPRKKSAAAPKAKSASKAVADVSSDAPAKPARKRVAKAEKPVAAEAAVASSDVVAADAPVKKAVRKTPKKSVSTDNDA